MDEKYDHVTLDSCVNDVINHPAFRGFGKHILPLEKCKDTDMPIRNIEPFLPYHNNINPETTVRSINCMIDEINSGRSLFIKFYSDEEIEADAEKENTGLFIFRGEPGAPFAVICAGGAFRYIGSIHEGFPHAIELCKRKYNAFVIQYRLGSGQAATEDLASAINFIFKNAGTLQVSTENYSLWGSSAGAIMAANIGTAGTEAYCGICLPKPAAVIMAYCSYDRYSAYDPPTFSVVGSDDKIGRTLAMENHIEDLLEAGIDAEFHKYSDVKHGFGLGTGTNAERWIEKAVLFWEKHIS